MSIYKLTSNNSVIFSFSSLAFERTFNPLPDDKILDWSKSKAFTDNNFKFDENKRKFFKWVENTVGKGEIAR